jgi:hypothetical protein
MFFNTMNSGIKKKYNWNKIGEKATKSGRTLLWRCEYYTRINSTLLKFSIFLGTGCKKGLKMTFNSADYGIVVEETEDEHKHEGEKKALSIRFKKRNTTINVTKINTCTNPKYSSGIFL